MVAWISVCFQEQNYDDNNKTQSSSQGMAFLRLITHFLSLYQGKYLPILVSTGTLKSDKALE